MRFFLTMMILSVSVGCSSKDGPDLAAATGQVIRDGQPLAGAVVEFYPDKGRRSAAITDEDGYFEMLYTPKEPGVIPGGHTVRFQVPGKSIPPEKLSKMSEYDRQQAIQRYSSPVTIKYEERVEVDPKGSEFTFDLTGKS